MAASGDYECFHQAGAGGGFGKVDARWGRAARALAAWQRLGTIAARDEFAGLMCDAYGVPAGAAREGLLAWWRVAVTDARDGAAAASVQAPGRGRVR